MTNRYVQAIKRMNKQLEPVCEKYNKRKIFFWKDALCAKLRYGLTPADYIELEFYKLSALERREYYVRKNKMKYEKLLNDSAYEKTFWAKQEFNRVFADFIKRDWLYTPEATDEEIDEFIRKHDKVIVKPSALLGGTGIHIYDDDSPEELRKNDTLLETFLKQHSVMSTLNPTSVNTVRMYTIVDGEGNPHILSAVLRVGRKGAEVDNFHSGGVSYPIDYEHGVVSGSGYNLAGERFLYHPRTKAKVIGFEIPNWNELVKYVFRATEVVPAARLIAWDVAILEDGFALIEGNYCGCLRVMQAPSREGKLRMIKKYS